MSLVTWPVPQLAAAHLDLEPTTRCDCLRAADSPLAWPVLAAPARMNGLGEAHRLD